MKRWLKGAVLSTVILGGTIGTAYYLGIQYKHPAYVEHVLEENLALTNYERKVSLSLSFDEKTSNSGIKESFQKLDGSVLVLEEKREKDNHYLAYSLISQDQDFHGEQFMNAKKLVFKSPMYHRYILFNEPDMLSQNEKGSSYLKKEVMNFLEENLSDVKLYKNLGANETGVTSLTFKGKNENLEHMLERLTMDMSNGTPYEEVLFNNERVTDRLLKKHQTEKEIQLAFDHNLSSIQSGIHEVLKQSTLKDSEITIKVTKEKWVKEWIATLDFVYTHKETREEIPFTIYLDVSTWNIGNTKVNEIQVDPTNSIPYQRMTDEIDYFENENLITEEDSKEDKAHVQQGFTEPTNRGVEENTMTLDEMGLDFTPVLPKPEESKEKTIKNNE
jgi:hypothetical protein